MEISKTVIHLAIAVLASIALIFTLNPLDLKCKVFSQCQLTIYNTGISIEAINKIGQLMTSQYIGETTCSDNLKSESKNVWYENQKNDIVSLFEKLQEAIDIIITTHNINSYRKIRNRLENNYPELYGHKYYELLVKKCSEKATFWWNQERIGLEEIRKAIAFQGLKSKGGPYYCGKRCEKALSDLLKNYETLKDETKLIYLGRGQVNAGINLSQLKYDSNPKETDIIDINDTFVINKLSIQIFDSIINPWFIPGRVKGYEIFLSQSKKVDFDILQAVKSHCKSNLKNDAIRAGIKLDALKNAESALLSLFSLNPNRPVNHVVIKSEDPIALFQESLINDNKVDNYEMNKLYAFVKSHHPDHNFQKIRYSKPKQQLAKLRTLVNEVNSKNAVTQEDLTVEEILQKK